MGIRIMHIESMYNTDNEPDARYNSLGFRLAQD